MSNAEMVEVIYNAAAKYGVIEVLCRVFGRRAKLNLGFSKKLCDTSIEELALSVRGYNVLRRSSLNTIGDVVDAINDKKLSSLRNLGDKTAREIKTKVVIFGYDSLSENEKKQFLSDVINDNTNFMEG